MTDDTAVNESARPVLHDKDLLDEIAAIAANLEEARREHLDDPESYLVCLVDIIERLISFGKTVDKTFSSPELEVYTTSLDEDVRDLMHERHELVTFFYGTGSSQHAEAAARWYAHDKAISTADEVMPAIIYSRAPSESHWECIRLLAMQKEGLGYCVAAFMLAEEHGRAQLAAECRERLSKDTCGCFRSPDAEFQFAPSGIHFEEPEMREIEVPSLRLPRIEPSGEPVANEVRFPVLEQARRTRKPKLIPDDAPQFSAATLAGAFGVAGQGVDCWKPLSS